jgi:hypothetical protein
MPPVRESGHRRSVTATISLPPTERVPAVVSQTVARLHAAARRRFERPQLAVLDEVHPGASLGTHVNLGVQAIDLADIRGTAVGGPRLRGADFKPIDAARTAGWQMRYARLRTAIDRMMTLPPIEVFEVGGEYWVVDGHNRVALARELRHAFVDANVIGIRWAGGPALRSQMGSMAAVLEAGAQQRAAASDRWRGTSASSMASIGGWRPTPCVGAACA